MNPSDWAKERAKDLAFELSVHAPWLKIAWIEKALLEAYRLGYEKGKEDVFKSADTVQE